MPPIYGLSLCPECHEPVREYSHECYIGGGGGSNYCCKCECIFHHGTTGSFIVKEKIFLGILSYTKRIPIPRLVKDYDRDRLRSTLKKEGKPDHLIEKYIKYFDGETVYVDWTE